MAPAAGIEIKPIFGPAGHLRARIESGETPDTFLSADMAAARKLEAQGRTIMPLVAFAQNRMCVIARQSLGVTPANLIDRLLSKTTRLKASTPVEDPSGDYTVAIFERSDVQRPGSGAILREKAQTTANAVKDAKPLDGHGAAASLFITERVNLMITYCSGAPALQQEGLQLAAVPFPPPLEPRPINGMAILSTKPGALRLALYLLSEKGQALVKAAGLLPVIDQAP